MNKKKNLENNNKEETKKEQTRIAMSLDLQYNLFTLKFDACRSLKLPRNSKISTYEFIQSIQRQILKN